jgi:hypothetical protein
MLIKNKKPSTPYTEHFERQKNLEKTFLESQKEMQKVNKDRFKQVMKFVVFFLLCVSILWIFNVKKVNELNERGISLNGIIKELVFNQYRANDKANYVISNYTIVYEYVVQKDTIIGIKTVKSSFVYKKGLKVNDSISIIYNPKDINHSRIKR